jgi:hypothetical protein
MSGLSRTPGKRVWVNSPPRVRIPPAPPKTKPLHVNARAFFISLALFYALPSWALRITFFASLLLLAASALLGF